MSFHGACHRPASRRLAVLRRDTGSISGRRADIYAATIPIGLGLGRIGNFINGELFGQTDGSALGRDLSRRRPNRPPSLPTLRGAARRGCCCFSCSGRQKHRPWQNRRYWPHGSILALFLIGYGLLQDAGRTVPGARSADRLSLRLYHHGPDAQPVHGGRRRHILDRPAETGAESGKTMTATGLGRALTETSNRYTVSA